MDVDRIVLERTSKLVYGCTETLKDKLNSLLSDYRSEYANNNNKYTKPETEKLLKRISVLKFQLNLKQRQYLVLKSLLVSLVDQDGNMSESTSGQPSEFTPAEEAAPPVVIRKVSNAFSSIHADLNRKLSVTQSEVMKNLNSKALLRRQSSHSSQSSNSSHSSHTLSAEELPEIPKQIIDFDYRMVKKMPLNSSLQLELKPRKVSTAVYELKSKLERKLSEGRPEAARRFSKSVDIYNNNRKDVALVVNPMAKILNSSVKLDINPRKSSDAIALIALNMPPKSSDATALHAPDDPSIIAKEEQLCETSPTGEGSRAKSPAINLVQQTIRPASGRPRSRGRQTPE